MDNPFLKKHNTRRLLAYECQMSAYRSLEKNGKADALDELTNGKITQMEYMVIFLNDQMYNTSIVIEDILRKNNRYRHKEKMLCNEIKKEIKKYNDSIANWSPSFVELIADVTASLEEDIKPSLDIYAYQISQAFLNNGISGCDNQMLTQTHILSVLHRMASTCLEGIRDLYFKHTSCYYTSLVQLEIKNIDRLASELSFISERSLREKKLVIVLASNEMAKKAFDVVLKKIWDTKLYDKAFENWNQ